jgi:uncharacterized protein (TIGR03066 family)
MLRTMCAALVAVTLLCPAAASAAGIAGKWNVVAAERQGKREPAPPADKGAMTVEFAKGGKFIATVARPDKTKTREGTWKANGNTLTTVVQGKTETMTIELKGTKLKLTDMKHPDRLLFLERAK